MFKRILPAALLVMLAGVFAAGSANADSLSLPDRAFLRSAAIGGLADVRLGELAIRKGVSAEVRDFGDRMVRDHGQGNDELRRLADSKGWRLPTRLDDEHRAIYERLTSLRGRSFDRAYTFAMLSDHRNDVREFEKASRSADDTDLRAWARDTLLTLRERLRIAMDINNGRTGRAHRTWGGYWIP